MNSETAFEVIIFLSNILICFFSPQQVSFCSSNFSRRVLNFYSVAIAGEIESKSEINGYDAFILKSYQLLYHNINYKVY